MLNKKIKKNISFSVNLEVDIVLFPCLEKIRVKTHTLHLYMKNGTETKFI